MQSSTSSTTLLPIVLVGLLLATGTSSLTTSSTSRQRHRQPAGGFGETHRHYDGLFRRRGGALNAITFEDLQRERQQQSQPQYTIPHDTSITNNPGIPTPSHAVTQRALRHQNKPGWLSYVLPSKQLLPEIVAEGFGTFLLLQLALGIVLSANFANSMQGVFPIAMLTGMAITAACAAVSSRCAAHFNPAITLSMCLYRNFGWNKAIPYMGAQLVGATGAALVNYALYAAKIAQWEAQHGIVRSSLAGLQTAKTMGCYFASPISPVAAFLAEAFGTFALSAVVFSLTSKNNDQVKGLFIPPIIGSAVALIISTIGPVTAASLNPARELGPRLVMKLFGWSSSVAFSQLGIYIAAAFTGATAGGWFVDNILYPDTTTNNKQQQQQFEFNYENAFQ